MADMAGGNAGALGGALPLAGEESTTKKTKEGEEGEEAGAEKGKGKGKKIWPLLTLNLEEAPSAMVEMEAHLDLLRGAETLLRLHPTSLRWDLWALGLKPSPYRGPIQGERGERGGGEGGREGGEREERRG